MPEMHNDDKRALLACSIWLRVGFVGASVAAVGLLQLFDLRPSWPSGLALLLCGAVVAAASWRRARRLLVQTEHHDPVPGVRSGPASFAR
jgi:hypothetical protein